MLVWMDNLPKPKERCIAIEDAWAAVFHLVPQVWAHQDYMLDIIQFLFHIIFMCF